MKKNQFSRRLTGPNFRFLLAVLVCCGFFVASTDHDPSGACEELCSDWGELVINHLFLSRTLVFRYKGPETGTIEIGASPDRQGPNARSIRLKPGIYYYTMIMIEFALPSNYLVDEAGPWMRTNAFQIRIGKTTTINNIPEKGGY